MSCAHVPRVVLLVDRPGWAFDFVARAFATRLGHRFAFRIVRRHAGPLDLDPGAIDLLYAFWWGDRSFADLGLPPEKVVREVASHRWGVEARYGELSPRAFAEAYLADCATVTTPSRRLHALLRPHHPRVLHLPNGVDTGLFRPRRRREGRLRVGWVGNPRDLTKGLHDVLEPACAGRFELLQSDGRRPQRGLVRLYQRADVIAIASLAEGQPLPLLEGMACGAFPVATEVGIVPELVRHGVNGLVVERSPEAFREAFGWCEQNLGRVRRAGCFNAALVAAERGWDALAPRFGDLLDAALGRGAWPAAELPHPDGPLRASLARGCLSLPTPARRSRAGLAARPLRRLAAAPRRLQVRTPLLSASHWYRGGGHVLDLRSGRTRRVVPSFLILGAMKCGTSSLFAALGRHPDLFASAVKEPGWLLPQSDARLRPYYTSANEIRGSLDDDRLLRRMLQGYRGEPLFFEASTHYTKRPEHGAGVPERCLRCNPDMKFVYMVRNPFDRIVSQYLHSVRRRYTDRDLNHTLEQDDLYLQISRYHHQIAPYADLFGDDRIHIVVFERFLRDPEACAQEVLAFVGAERRALDAGRAVNVSASRADFAAEELRFTPENYERLLAILAPEVERLSRRFGIDLSLWDLSKERHCLG